MGKQAARMGDTAMTCNDPTDMPVGTVVSTTATVLINKMPAAKKGDQIIGVDTHIVMIPSPGGPVPTPIPHPFMGMIDNGLSTSVKIMGQFAATVDSQATNTPSHIPIGGPSFQKPPSNKAKIIMGSANVFIGNGGGGGGGGSSGGSAKGSEGKTAAVEQAERHYVDIKFEDKGGKPISGLQYKVKGPDNSESTGSLAGGVKQATTEEGNAEVSLHGITQAKWSAKEIETGKAVKIEIKCPGFDDGIQASMEIYMRDTGFADRLLKVIYAEVSGEEVKTEWTFEMDEEFLDIQKKKGKRYSTPTFFYKVRIADSVAQSDILKLKDWVELEFKDKEGKPLKDIEYRATLSNGEVREGKLDGNGKAKLEKVPPGFVKCRLLFEGEDSSANK